MTEKKWTPNLSKYDRPTCIICGERITTEDFIASKQRKGGVLFAHAHCFEKEQQELKEGKG